MLGTRMPTRWRGRGRYGWLLLLLLAAACTPPATINPVVSDVQVEMIQPERTTHREILDIVGPPDTVWETERIWVYEEGPMRHFLLIPPVYVGAGLARNMGADLFFIRFDEDYRVERVGRLQGETRLRDTYGDLLRRWLAEQVDASGAAAK